MTSQFNFGTAAPVFGGDVVLPAQGNRKPVGNVFRTFRTSQEGVLGWELFVNSLSRGLGDATWDVVSGNNGPFPLLRSSLDHRFPGSLPLPSKTATQDMGVSVAGRICSAFEFGTFVIGWSNDANDALWIETSNTNPTMVERTYSPTSVVTGLHSVVQNSTQYLAVCRQTDPIQLLSDLGTTPTVAGTMHTDTDASYGMCTTFLPHPSGGFYNLIYSSNAIRSLNSTASIGTQPTAVTSNVPNGGGFLTIKAPRGWPLSPWWQIPHANQSILSRGGLGANSLVRTNAEGSDYQAIDTPYPEMYAVAPWREGFVMSLHRNALPHGAFYWDGQTFEPLPFATEGETPDMIGGSTSGIDWRIYGFYVRGDDLYAEVYRNEENGDGSTRHIEWYDPLSRRFYQITGDIDDGVGTAMDTARAIGSLPVSPLTGFFHTIQDYASGGDNNVFHRAFIGPSFTNPFYLLGGGGLGPSTGAAHTFEASGVATSPLLRLQGIAQFPKVCTEIIGLFGWRDGNKDSSVKVEVAELGSSHPFIPSFSDTGTAVTFSEADRMENTRQSITNPNPFLELQFRVTLTQGTGTGDTPNGLPFILRGVAFTDGKYDLGRIPAEMREESWR